MISILRANSVGVFSENTISANDGSGISLNSIIAYELTHNIVELNEAGGINVVNSSGSLSGNQVSENLNFGVSLNASENTLTENDIYGNSGPGVIINGTANTLSENSIYDNGVGGAGAGVFADGIV